MVFLGGRDRVVVDMEVMLRSCSRLLHHVTDFQGLLDLFDGGRQRLLVAINVEVFVGIEPWLVNEGVYPLGGPAAGLLVGWDVGRFGWRDVAEVLPAMLSRLVVHVFLLIIPAWGGGLGMWRQVFCIVARLLHSVSCGVLCRIIFPLWQSAFSCPSSSGLGSYSYFGKITDRS